MEKRKVIIDCDPGIDDALALLLALKSEELELVGITIVTAQDTHGDDGLGETYYPIRGEIPIKKGGVSFIVEVLKKDEKAFKKLHSLVSMGGAYRIHGNCSPVAEFNYLMPLLQQN